MKIRLILASIAVYAALAGSGPAFAAANRSDGTLPMYPHANLDPKEASLTPDAIAHGVPLVLLTADSVGTVDSWYGDTLRKRCSRNEASGGIKYACEGGSIMIYAHAGQTQIALIPPMPGL
jgi:hypothetical protein